MRVAAAIAIVSGAAAIAAAAVYLGRPKPMQPTSEPKTTPRPSSGGKFPTPIAVGDRSSGDVAALLRELDALLRDAGAGGFLSAAEVTEMPKTPGRKVAIPPREYWPRMVATVREVFVPIRQAMGVPLAVRGYRPPDYNRAVGGTKKSRHQAFEALDIRLVGDGDTADRRRELARRAAQIYASRGRELKMGLGIYGFPTPNTVHVDTGHQRRVWGDTRKHLEHLANS